MGFPLQPAQAEVHPEKDLQKYYSHLYREITEADQEDEHTSLALCSILTRTRVPTATRKNRALALLDIDKIISLNQSSLDERGERVKYMRMVSGLMQQNIRTSNPQPNRQIQNLVRLARLHYLSVNRDGDEESDEREAETERI
jgi:hypothetical protein